MADPSRQILHIGLAKTGTTTLQRYVFPQISRFAGYAYNPPDLIECQTNFLLLNDPDDRRRVTELRAAHSPIFVSDEALATWTPQHFASAADVLLSLWGKHTTILITLRDQEDFQASLYAGSYRAGAYVPPQNYFLSEEQYNRVRSNEGHWADDFFNVDQFDLRRLIAIYEERFDQVVALPKQTLFELHGLARVFNLTEDQRRSLAKQVAAAPGLNSRPASWDIKAHTLYVSLTGKSLTKPALGTKMKAGRQLRSLSPSFRRRLWLRLRAILYRILPNTPYQLPGDVYRNTELNQSNREFLAELVAEEQATGPN